MPRDPQTVGRNISVSVALDVVTLQIKCGDGYEAQVLYDDLRERLESGQGLALGVLRTREQGG